MSRKTFVSLYERNELCFDDGVRLIKNLQVYIAHHTVDVMIATILIQGDPTSLIPSLSYEQALAFYNWKFPIDKFNAKNDTWDQDIFLWT